MDEKTARAAEDPLVESDENLQLEQDVIAPLASQRKMYAYETSDFWRQIKTAASAVTASSLYLRRFAKTCPELLAPKAANIIEPVFVHPTASIDPSAKVGPDVAIGPGVVIGAGARVANAMILAGSTIDKHAVVVNSIVGSEVKLGQWARVDGEPEPETEVKGQISVSVIGSEVGVAPEVHVRSCIVLPNVSEDCEVCAQRRPSDKTLESLLMTLTLLTAEIAHKERVKPGPLIDVMHCLVSLEIKSATSPTVYRLQDPNRHTHQGQPRQSPRRGPGTSDAR